MKLTFKRKTSFYWKLLYLLIARTVVYLVSFLSLITLVLTTHGLSNYLIISFLAVSLIWPLLANYIAANRIFPKAEKVNLLIDGFIFGFYLGCLGIPLWMLLLPAAMFGNFSSSYGYSFAIQFAIVFYSTMAASFFLLGQGLFLDTNEYTIIISFFATIVITFTSGLYTYGLIKNLSRNKNIVDNALQQEEQTNALLESSIASLELDKISKMMFDYFNGNILDFDLLTIQHIDHKNKTLSYQAILARDEIGFKVEALKAEVLQMDGTLLAEKSITMQKAYIVHDIDQEAISVPDKKFQEISAMKGLAIFPYFVKNKVSGLVCLYSREAFELDKNTINVLSNYIRHISLGIKNSLLYATLKSNAKKLKKTHKKLEHISRDLGMYLSPQVLDQIFVDKIQEQIKTKKKYLTIFMSDIVNFTKTVNKADSAGLNQQLNEELNEYLSAMTKIAFEYGGTVNKYIGDAIMIVFGDPSSSGSKQDAIRAVRMAYKMLTELAALNQKLKVMRYDGQLKVRIGICSGYANVGNYGSEFHMDYTVVGSVVNLASRLHDIAEPNTIIVTSSTRKLVQNDFRISDYGQHKIQGFDDKIQTWKIIS